MPSARRSITHAATLWKWRYDTLHSGLPPAARLMLLATAHHLRDDFTDSVMLSVRTLCTETGLDAEAIKIGLRDAIDAGFLLVSAIDENTLCLTRKQEP